MQNSGLCREISWYKGRTVQEQTRWDSLKSSALLQSPKAGSALALPFLADVLLYKAPERQTKPVLSYPESQSKGGEALEQQVA